MTDETRKRFGREWILDGCRESDELARIYLSGTLNVLEEGGRTDGVHLESDECVWLAACLRNILEGKTAEQAFYLVRRGARHSWTRDFWLIHDYYALIHRKRWKASAAELEVCKRWDVSLSTLKRIRSAWIGKATRKARGQFRWHESNEEFLEKIQSSGHVRWDRESDAISVLLPEGQVASPRVKISAPVLLTHLLLENGP